MHQETLALVRDALRKADAGELKKSWTQSGSATTGLTYYNLEAPSKSLYPVLTPLRNTIPRVDAMAGGGAGIQANWKAVTAINTSLLTAGVSEGNRGGVVSTSTADYFAAFKGLGLEDWVSFEADYSAQGFEDVKARATRGLLESLMLQEERILLGGNTSVLLGTTPTPSLSDLAASGGTLAFNVQHRVICVALTLQGWMRSTVAGGVSLEYTKTNADGTTDTVGGGGGAISTAATVTTSNDSLNTHSIAATVTAVRGAVAYAWYLGTTAGTERLAQITFINSAKLTAINGAGQLASALPAGDKSLNSLEFDGLMYIAYKSGSNAYFKTMDTGTAGTGTPLTSDQRGGIVELDEALQSMWDNYRLSPTTIWVSSQEAKNIGNKILEGNASAAQRFTFQVNQAGVIGGTSPKGYLNKFGMTGAVEIPIKQHPNLPFGTIVLTSESIPYPLSNVQDVYRVLTRKEYYQMEWPLRTRRYEYGVYCDEVLQHYFPPSIGIITNIANG